MRVKVFSRPTCFKYLTSLWDDRISLDLIDPLGAICLGCFSSSDEFTVRSFDKFAAADLGDL